MFSTEEKAEGNTPSLLLAHEPSGKPNNNADQIPPGQQPAQTPCLGMAVSLLCVPWEHSGGLLHSPPTLPGRAQAQPLTTALIKLLIKLLLLRHLPAPCPFHPGSDCRGWIEKKCKQFCEQFWCCHKCWKCHWLIWCSQIIIFVLQKGHSYAFSTTFIWLDFLQQHLNSANLNINF